MKFLSIIILILLDLVLLIHGFFYNPFLEAARRFNFQKRFFDNGVKRIINGLKADEGQFPHQVSIGFYCPNGYYQHNCGGAAISPRWILTAAHCAGKTTGKVVLAGLTDLKQRQDENEYLVQESITHPEYIPLTASQNGFNDIALLKLDRDLKFGENLQPIELSSKDLPDRAALIISGWGRTSCEHTKSCQLSGNLASELQYLQVRYVNNVKCYSIFHNGEKSSMDPTYLCTVPRKGTGAYQGDSGGPLIYKNKLAGIAFAVGPCGQGYPDVFTRISKFINWIQKNIEDDEDYNEDYNEI